MSTWQCVVVRSCHTECRAGTTSFLCVSLEMSKSVSVKWLDGSFSMIFDSNRWVIEDIITVELQLQNICHSISWIRLSSFLNNSKWILFKICRVCLAKTRSACCDPSCRRLSLETVLSQTERIDLIIGHLDSWWLSLIFATRNFFLFIFWWEWTLNAAPLQLITDRKPMWATSFSRF